MKDTTRAVIIIPPNRMAVVAVFGDVKASIMNMGSSPIAIIFICISLIFKSDSLSLLFFIKTIVRSLLNHICVLRLMYSLKKKLPEIYHGVIGLAVVLWCEK